MLEPKLPEKWDTLQIDYRFGEAMYRIRMSRDAHARVECDGVAQTGMSLQLSPDKVVHEVQVYVAR